MWSTHSYFTQCSPDGVRASGFYNAYSHKFIFTKAKIVFRSTFLLAQSSSGHVNNYNAYNTYQSQLRPTQRLHGGRYLAYTPPHGPGVEAPNRAQIVRLCPDQEKKMFLVSTQTYLPGRRAGTNQHIPARSRR